MGKIKICQSYRTRMSQKCPSVRLAFPGARDSKVTVSCHSELTVALYAVKYLPYTGLIGLGVSKRVCWLCQKFLERFCLHSNNRILVSEYQGKCHAGWRINSNTPDPVEEDMRHLVQQEVDEIREPIYGRKRSDSFPSDRSFLVEEEPGLPEYISTQDLNENEYWSPSIRQIRPFQPYRNPRPRRIMPSGPLHYHTQTHCLLLE